MIEADIVAAVIKTRTAGSSSDNLDESGAPRAGRGMMIAALHILGHCICMCKVGT